MFSVVKKYFFTFILLMSIATCSAQAKKMSILVIGESISANCNQYKYPKIEKIYQIDLQGNSVPAKDPFIWSDCQGGSIWMPLGQLIIQHKMADEVVFMPIGMSGTSVKDWLPNGNAYPKLELAMKQIKQNQLKFDYIFWYQGHTDTGMSSEDYQRYLMSFVLNVRKLGDLQSSRFLIARHSKCFRKESQAIWEAQTFLSKKDNYRLFFLGPDTNLLNSHYQLDNCHLNQIGQFKMAELWFESLKNVQKNDRIYKKETLIDFFGSK